MERFLYIIIVVAVITGIFLRPRITPNQIAALSTIVFSSPLLFGFYFSSILDPFTLVEISGELYFIYIIPLLIFFFVSYFERPFFSNSQFSLSNSMESDRSSRHVFQVFFSLIIVLLVYQVSQAVFFDSFSSKKSDIEKIPAFHVFVNFVLAFCVVYVSLRRKFGLLFFFIFIALVFMILTKSRSPLAFSILSAFVSMLYFEKVSKKSKFRMAIVVLVSVFFLVLMNQFLGLVLLGRFDYVFSKVFEASTYELVFRGMQANINIELADSVLKENLSFSEQNFIFGISRVVPFSEIILGVGYEKWSVLIKDRIFPQGEWGVAGNAFAQSYSVFGWFGLCFMSFFWAVLNYLVYVFSFAGSSSTRICSMALIPYLSFFFVRQDIWATLSVCVNSLVLFFLVYMVVKLTPSKARIQRSLLNTAG